MRPIIQYMKVSEIGESNTIRHIEKLIKGSSPKKGAKPSSKFSLLSGIGDDAAIWSSSNTFELYATDTLVEGTHFPKRTTSPIQWYDLGWKAIAVNLSDIAAMGGQPLYALVALGIPKNLDLERLDELYKGMLTICSEYNVSIAGGDIVKSDTIFLTISIVGTSPHSPMMRKNAKEGDAIAVTGFLGSSNGGLRMILDKMDFEPETTKCLARAHWSPNPRIIDGINLCKFGVKCAMDISDGLVKDLTEICDQSSVSANIRLTDIPIDPILKKAFPDKYQDMALSGGEDYELIFTAPQRLMPEIISNMKTPTSVIGEIVKKSTQAVTTFDSDGMAVTVESTGWDQLR